MAINIYNTVFGYIIFKNNKLIMKELYIDYSAYIKEQKDGSIKKKLLRKFPRAEFGKVLPNLSNFIDEFYSRFYNFNLVNTKHMIKKSILRENLISQVANNIDDVEKVINLLIKRLREWYSLYLPELSETFSEHEKFVEFVLNNDKKQLIKKLNVSHTMGADFDRKDVNQIIKLADELKRLYDLKQSHTSYLEDLMNDLCPNLTVVAGSVIGAKLITHAGGIKDLARMPSSTVQLLGAEKALFRHIKTNARCPRHGLIVNHSLLANAKQKDHGKIARHLASAISKAVRIDYFSDKTLNITTKKHKNIEGKKLREKLDLLFSTKRK